MSSLMKRYGRREQIRRGNPTIRDVKGRKPTSEGTDTCRLYLVRDDEAYVADGPPTRWQRLRIKVSATSLEQPKRNCRC